MCVNWYFTEKEIQMAKKWDLVIEIQTKVTIKYLSTPMWFAKISNHFEEQFGNF